MGALILLFYKLPIIVTLKGCLKQWLILRISRFQFLSGFEVTRSFVKVDQTICRKSQKWHLSVQ